MAVRQALICLTLLSFLCRAAIPVGYMPDLSGDRGAAFAMALCSMGGAAAVMQVGLSDDADGKAASGDAHAGEDCPFGLAAGQTLMPGQAAPALHGAIAFHSAAPAFDRRAPPALPALGPPLGSRAPPSLPA